MLQDWERSFEDRLGGRLVIGRMFFLEDNWMGYDVLKSKFPRLFSLLASKDAKLFRCRDWVNNV